jgi:hypothetical protein
MLATMFRAATRRSISILMTLTLLCVSGLSAADDGTRAAAAQQPDSAHGKKDTHMNIQMTVGGAIIATATLDNNESAKDFAMLLPLHLTLKDYAATEKIADLPRRLSIKGAPEAYTPSAGDISFYAPWGNLAIFYKDGHLSSGLVRLGRLDSGMDAVRRNGPVAVRIELAQQ